MEIISEILRAIFTPLIEAVIGIFFNLGILIFDLLGLKKKKEELGFWAKVLISLSGATLILILISCSILLLFKL